MICGTRMLVYIIWFYYFKLSTVFFYFLDFLHKTGGHVQHFLHWFSSGTLSVNVSFFLKLIEPLVNGFFIWSNLSFISLSKVNSELNILFNLVNQIMRCDFCFVVIIVMVYWARWCVIAHLFCTCQGLMLVLYVHPTISLSTLKLAMKLYTRRSFPLTIYFKSLHSFSMSLYLPQYQIKCLYFLNQVNVSGV